MQSKNKRSVFKQQRAFDRHITTGSTNQRIGRQPRHAIRHGLDAMLADDTFEQQIEITVPRSQHHFINLWRNVHDVDGDPHVPVALGRAIATLDIRLEFDGETQVAQDLLELLLLAVATVDGIGIGFDDLAALADISPQGRVIEVAAMGLAHGVIEVLYVGEHSDLFHRISSWRDSRLNRRPVCQLESRYRANAQTAFAWIAHNLLVAREGIGPENITGD